MRRDKVCDLCGRSYYRRSITETWDRQNPGHRAGWHKAVIRACTTCVPERVAQRVMIVSTVRAVSRANPTDAEQRKRTSRFLRELEKARQRIAVAANNVIPIRRRAVG